MPTVQRYGARKVATAAIPGVRKQAAETDISTGAGLAHAKGQAAALTADALGRLGGTAANVGLGIASDRLQVLEQEKKRATEVASLEWSNTFDKWENERLYGAGGALSRKGRDAQGLPEEVGGEFDQVAGDMAARLVNDDQRRLFAKEQSQRRQNLDATIYRHVFREQQTYEAAELQAFQSNKVQAAVANSNDPRRVGLEVAAGEEKLRVSLPRQGLGPEAVEDQVRTFKTAALEGVIMQQLAEEKPAAARAYFEEAQDAGVGFDEKAITRITNALNVGKVRGAAQKQTAEILAAGGTLAEQRAKAKAIDDPDVQDAVLQRIEHEDGIRKAQDRQAEETLLTDAYSAVDKTADVDKLPPATIAKLGAHLPALRAYADKRAKGESIETDWPTYYGSLQQAADDPAAFAKVNLYTLRGKLDDVEFKELAHLQLSLKSGDRKKADAALAGVLTNTQVIHSTLEQYGIDPTPKTGTPEAAAVAQLQRMLSLRVEAAQQPDQNGKRKPVSDVEIQRTLDDLLSQSVKVPGSWWNFWPGGKSVSDTTKPLIRSTYADVPAEARKTIEAKLQKRGLAVSEATILNIWLESQVK